MTLFFAWGFWRRSLADAAFNHGGRQAEVELTATTAQRSIRETFSVEMASAGGLTGVTLYGNYLPQKACAGQRWTMTLRLRPVHGELNDGGYDSQRSALPDIKR
jgi:competence protein ComEC